MSKEELLRIYSAYLPYGLEMQIEEEIETEYTTFLGEFDSIMPGVVKLAGITHETSFMPECLLYTREDGEGHGYIQLENAKLILYSMDMLTQPIEHKGKTVTPIIKLLNQASLYDLSDCEFEINIDDEEIYIDAYNGGRLVDAMFYNGNIFKMNGNTKYYPPQIDLNELMLELHLNVFNLPDSAYIKKENLNGNDTNVATKNLKK